MSKKTTGKPPPQKPRTPPELKIGPFTRGLGVAIWLNTTETDDGPKSFRTITIAPRRYQDKKTGAWLDAKSFHPSDLPALIFALQKAQEFVFTKPLPGQESEADQASAEETPF